MIPTRRQPSFCQLQTMAASATSQPLPWAVDRAVHFCVAADGAFDYGVEVNYTLWPPTSCPQRSAVGHAVHLRDAADDPPTAEKGTISYIPWPPWLHQSHSRGQ